MKRNILGSEEIKSLAECSPETGVHITATDFFFLALTCATDLLHAGANSQRRLPTYTPFFLGSVILSKRKANTTILTLTQTINQTPKWSCSSPPNMLIIHKDINNKAVKIHKQVWHWKPLDLSTRLQQQLSCNHRLTYLKSCIGQ